MAHDDLKGGLEDLREIRSIMERATRFLSLSGLSGVSAGGTALLGTAAAFWYLREHGFLFTDPAAQSFLVTDGLIVLVVAASLAVFFSRRMALKKKLRFGGPAAVEVLIGLGVPLLSGGIFLIVLISRGLMVLVPGSSMVFYGLALEAASRASLRELRQLGIAEIAGGLAAVAVPEAAVLLWAIGFGVLHIVYGVYMFRKFER